MNSSSATRASRIRALAIGGLGAIALIAASAPATSTASAAPAAEDRVVKCQKHRDHSSARVKKGVPARKDPNSLTRRQIKNLENKFARATRGMKGDGPNNDDNLFHVPVYIHILKGKDNAGAVSRQRIENQMGILNNGFRGRVEAGGEKTPFEFDLKGIDVTQNAAWYRHFPGSKAEKRMKRTLRVGDAHALNVYLANPRPRGLLGYATFPQWYNENPQLDGVVVNTDSLPGGDYGPYAHGDTLTHEVGHWLGLYHTFQGGCSKRGDYVTDTPKEQSPNFGYCPGGNRDTCPAAGNDPVTNFMDYSFDACLNTFSRGQADRMRLSYKAFRR